MDEAAENLTADHPSLRARLHQARDGLLKPKPAVRPRLVVVADVLGEHRLEMSPGHGEEVVEAVLPHGAHESFGERVRSG